MGESAKFELDEVDLDQFATVIWDGPTHHISSLSKAVRYVVESISDTKAMDPLIAISEEPFLLEAEQIIYIYNNRLSEDANRISTLLLEDDHGKST